MRRAANVAERRSDKMNVFIFLITGIYLSVMAVIDHRLQKIPVLPGVIGILVIVLARVVDGDFWMWMPGVAVGVFLYLMSKATRGAVGEGDALVYLMTGVTLGFFGNIELLTLSLFFSAIVSVFLLVFRKVGKKKRVPFVPFIGNRLRGGDGFMKEASYTVEAVFVGCITIWVILALLYSSFYIHDRMILGSEIGNRIECGSERGELSVSEKEENNLCRLLNEKLFLMKINQVSLTKKIASVRADVWYSLPISLSEIKALFVTRETGQNFVFTKELIRPMEMKWDYDLLKGKGGGK